MIDPTTKAELDRLIQDAIEKYLDHLHASCGAFIHKIDMASDIKDAAYTALLSYVEGLLPRWRPYPKEKPTKQGWYDVSRVNAANGEAHFDDDHWAGSGEWEFSNSVYAWRERSVPAPLPDLEVEETKE